MKETAFWTIFILMTVHSLTLSSDVLKVKAQFEPVVKSSMMFNRTVLSEEEIKCLRHLYDWKQPQKSEIEVNAESFEVFLPPSGYKVGDVYPLYRVANDSLSHDDLVNAQTQPPSEYGKEEILFRLLSMFHPRAFLRTRFPPRGGVAVVRAESDDHLAIVFRIHAEFQLSDKENDAFWLTPSQFEGEIFISKNLTDVHQFHLRVPNERLLNVDMEWLCTSGSEVDIGFLPEMRLDLEKDSQSSENQWKRHIPVEAAKRLINAHMYPFLKVDYHPLPWAIRLSVASRRPLHSIVLWGSLDDQSC